MNSNTKSFLDKKFFKIRLLKSNKEKIIDFDKLYHKILLELGYKGTFGEILKSSPSIIDNLDTIWSLHKLRNKLVHEFGDFSDEFLLKNSVEYEKVIYKFINKL